MVSAGDGSAAWPRWAAAATVAATAAFMVLLAGGPGARAQVQCTTTFLPASGSWGTGAHWSAGVTPGTEDDACIPAGREVQVDSGSTAVVRSVQGAGTVALSGGTLSVAEQSAVAGLTLNAGSLTGAGDLTITSSFSTAGGAMSGSGRTIVASTVTAGTITGGRLDRTLVNRGTLTGSQGRWEGTSKALLENAGTFVNNLGMSYGRGMMRSTADATPAIRNSGMYRKTGGESSSAVQWQFENAGEVRVDAGGIGFSGGGIPGAVPATGTWSGLGQAALSGGSWDWGPGTQISGNVWIGSAVTVPDVQVTGSLDVNGTLTLTDPFTSSRLGATTLTGTLTGAGSFEMGSTFTWQGTLSGTGTTTVPMWVTLPIATARLDRKLVNRGTIIAGPGRFEGTSNAWLENEGTFTNNLGYTYSKGMMRASATATPTVRNRGLFQKTAGEAISLMEWRFENGGEVRVNDGEMQINAARIQGAPAVSGTWSGPGTISLEGVDEWGPGVRIPGNLRLSGDVSAQDVQVTGHLDLQGTLKLNDPATVSTMRSLRLSGTLDGAGAVDINSAFTWAGGLMTGTGQTTIGSSVSTTMTDGALDRKLVNHGSLTVTNSFSGTSNAMFENHGTFTNNISHYLGGGMLRRSTGATPKLRNHGVLRKTAGTELTEIAWQFENRGDVQANNGSIHFTGGGIPDSRGTGTWSGPGKSVLSGGPHPYAWGPNVRVSGNVVGGDIDAMDVQVTGSLTPGTLTLNDPNVVSNIRSLIMESGTITGPGDVFIEESMSWKGGTFAGTGKATIASAVKVGPEVYGTVRRTVVNRGTITMTKGHLSGGAGGVLENRGTIIDNVEAVSGWDRNSLFNPPEPEPRPVLRNFGQFLKTAAAGSGTTIVEWPHDDRGLSVATVGNLVFTGPNVTPIGGPEYPGMPSDMFGGDNPAMPGMTHCDVADPVNCSTGNFFEEEVDLSVAGRGRGLTATRAYNALAAALETGVPYSRLSPGWTHGYASRLQVLGDGVVLTGGNAATARFNKRADGSFTAGEAVKARLARGADGTYVVTYPSQIQDVYDSTGQLVRQVDRNGYATVIAYTSAGLIETVTDDAGRVLTYGHDATGRIQTITDPLGRKVTYGYDAQGELETVTDVKGGVTRYGYDGQHRIVSMRDPRGHLTTNEYDLDARVKKQTDARGGTISFAYSAGATTVTDARGHVTRYEQLGGLTHRVVHAVGTARESATSMVRDASGNVTQRTGPDGQVTKVEYDARGNVTKLTDPLNRVTTMTYSAANDVETVADPDATTTFTYDAGGNLLTASRPLTGTSSVARTTYAYDPARPGDVVSMTDPNGQFWKYTYDAHGNQVRAEDPLGSITTSAYNVLGWLTSTVSPRGNVAGGDPSQYRTTIAYDEFGAPVSVTNPLGEDSRTTYDANGNVLTYEDLDGRVTATEYDELDRPVKVTRPDATVLRFAYDANGNRTRVTDALGHATAFTHDELDRVTAQTDALNRVTSFSYDASGRTVAEVDAAGRTTTFGYDAASQLRSIRYGDRVTPNVALDYDALGRRKQMVDGTGTSSWAYDSLGRLKTATDGSGRALTYAFDLAGRLKKIGYPPALIQQTAAPGQTPTSSSISFGRNAVGDVSQVIDWFGSATAYTYTRDGQIAKTIYPNSVVARFTYDRAGGLVNRADSTAAGTLLSLPYTRRASGRVQTQNPSGLAGGASAALSYDARQQLTQVDAGAGGVSAFSHDDGDRLTRLREGLSDTRLEYDAANQLVRAVAQDGSVAGSFTYDALGNRRSEEPAPGAGGVAPPGTTYAYDQANRLTRAARPATAFAAGFDRAYAYDGDGLRADLLWDASGGLPLVLGDASGLYVPGADGLPLEQVGFDGSRRFVHHDQLGSTRMLTDAAGAVTSRHDYSAFGSRTSTGEETPVFGFAGQYTDGQTGLIYMRARWYDPATGQFITSDPIGLASGETNLYRYAANDPANRVDPLGLCSINPLSSDSCYAEPAAKILDGVTGGLSTKLAGAVFDFDADCTGWGDSGIALAAGFAGFGKFRNGLRLAAKAPRTVVIGRDMKRRVIPYAERHGYQYYRGTPRAIPFRSQRVDLWLNKRWIKKEVRRGSDIVDIGQPPGCRRAPSTTWNDRSRAATRTTEATCSHDSGQEGGRRHFCGSSKVRLGVRRLRDRGAFGAPLRAASRCCRAEARRHSGHRRRLVLHRSG